MVQGLLASRTQDRKEATAAQEKEVICHRLAKTALITATCCLATTLFPQLLLTQFPAWSSTISTLTLSATTTRLINSVGLVTLASGSYLLIHAQSLKKRQTELLG